MDFRDLFSRASQCVTDGVPHEAMALFDRCLLERDDFHPAWNSRGATLQKMGDPFDAILCYNRAIELVPNSGEYYNNRGVAYMELELFDRAIDDFKRAANRNPKIAEIHNNRGNALTALRKPESAIEAYSAAIEIRPEYADAHVGLAMSKLMLGDLPGGLKEFEWRWQSGPMRARGFTIPQWEGEKAQHKDDILLLYGEQGMGDVLQFCRFAPQVKEKWGGKVWLEVTHPLARLLKDIDGIDGLVSLGEKPPANIKRVVAMISAPRILGTTLETIPNKSYIKADPYRAGLWRDRVKALPPGLLVGVCWAGMNRERDKLASSIDARRSMTLGQLKPLGGVQGASWVSLQLGPSAEQIKNNPAGMTILDDTSQLHDWYDTAALVSCLDLIITVDTSVAHLAGAMGKPTWVFSRHDACWRWLMDRDDTPWYPTMRLFTQKKRHDWGEVIGRVHVELTRLANQHRLKAA